MKKTLTIVIMLVLTFILVSCDYPEKSFNALNIEDIPKEVTRDFGLPRGVYAPFVWTSDNNAISIENQTATVTQKDEDVLVTLTATINKTSRSFKILVMRIGSDRTYREKAEDALIDLKEAYTEIDEKKLELPKTIDGLYIKYYPQNDLGEYGFYEDEEKAYISSGFNADNKNVSLLIAFYKDSDFNNYDNYVYSGYLKLYANKLKEDDLYIQLLEVINIHNYWKNFKFNFNLELNDFVEFASHDEYEVYLDVESSKVKRISNTKVQVIRHTEGNSYMKGYLTITIENMPKKILITIYCKDK